MTIQEFQTTNSDQFRGPLLVLWWDAQGNWERAHEIAQEREDSTSAWVHAYLHRKEGDDENAKYWYRRAGRPAATGSLEVEWAAMVETILMQPPTGMTRPESS